MYKPRTSRITILTVGIVILAILLGIFILSNNEKIQDGNILKEPEPSIKQVAEDFIISNDSVPEENSPELPEVIEQEVELSAWIAYWDLYGAIDVYKKNVDSINSLSPTWYFVQEDGSLGLKNTARNNELITLTRNNGTKLIPSISNSNADSLSRIINDATLVTKHINSIVSEVSTYSYDGIDIDYEAIKGTDTKPFSDFIKELSEELHKNNKKLTIAILWKNELAPYIEAASDSRAAQDWEEIGKYVDEFRIMAYDYTHSYETEGPIAPKDWIGSILEYALDKVDSQKIVLGLPLYAYEWSEGIKGAKAFVWEDVQNVKSIYKSSIISDTLNPTKLENELKYNNGKVIKVIWYQDSETTKKRIEFAKTYGVFKFVFWRMGEEDPETYNF